MRQFPIVLILVAASYFCGPARAFPEEGRRLAFLVAVTEYSHAGLDPLEFTERDIDDMAKRLVEVGFDVYSLTPRRGQIDPRCKPTAENIRKRLMEFLRHRKVDRHDLVLLGLSGHGLQPRGSAESFFCPVDANPSMEEIESGKLQKPKEPKTLVSVAELLTMLDESGAGHKLVLVDACRNEPKTKGTKSTGIDKMNLVGLPPQTAVLMSCSKGEFSFENARFGGGHGAFFASVLDGLSGKAVDEEKQITWDSLQTYVRKKVPQSVQKVFGVDGGRQHPNLVSNVAGGSPILVASTHPQGSVAETSEDAQAVAFEPPALPEKGKQGKVGVPAQIRFVEPFDTKLQFQDEKGRFVKSLTAKVPATVNCRTASKYQLKLSEILGREGLELFPSLQVFPTRPATEEYFEDNAVVIQITEDELDLIQSGISVVKVYYLPKPQFAELRVANIEFDATPVYSTATLDPGIDPIAEADRRGTILAVFRLGTKRR